MKNSLYKIATVLAVVIFGLNGCVGTKNVQMQQSVKQLEGKKITCRN